MSAKQNQDEKSQNPPAGQEGTPPNPIEAAQGEATNSGETEEQRIAKAVAAVHQANPSLTPDEIADIVAKVFKKTETIEAKVDKETARIIQPVDNTYKDKVYLKKDKNRQFPLEREALNGIIVRQSYMRKTEEGDEIEVPARNLNELAIYTKDEFERLSKPGQGFERQGIKVEVWHKPGQEDTVQD